MSRGKNKNFKNMKKILCLLALLCLSNSIFCQIVYLVDEDFESYTVGTFPSSGGWELVFDGYGDDYQYVTNTTSISGSKSLQLEGAANWSANAVKNLSSTPDIVYLEGYVKPTKVEPSVMNYPVASISFFNKDAGTWGSSFAWVFFNWDYKIYLYGATAVLELQPYTEGQWYKIKIKYDKVNQKVDVWIDNILKASNFYIGEQNSSYNSVCLFGGNDTHTRSWFDDVKVYYDSNGEGISDINVNDFINVFPNPATNILNIVIDKNYSTKNEINILLYNVLGEIVAEKSNKDGNIIQIDLGSFNEGIYNVNVKTNEGIVDRKIVILK